MGKVPPDLNPEAIITGCYPVGSRTRDLLLHHGELVGRKALDILDQAPWLEADRGFVVQAAMLHDIGISQTHCPELGCTGTLPYVCHGVAGRAILDNLGLYRHGLVCERHVGAGISADQTLRRSLPLPPRDMFPISIEERLICYADNFYSKTDNGRHEKTIDAIIAGLTCYDASATGRFLELHRWFTRNPINAVGSANKEAYHGETHS